MIMKHRIGVQSSNCYNSPGARANRMNVSDNMIHLVKAAWDYRAIFRILREAYHTGRAIAS